MYCHILSRRNHRTFILVQAAYGPIFRDEVVTDGATYKTAAVAEKDSIIQAYIRAYHALVPERTIEEEEAEEREWHAIISQPHVQQGLLRLAEEIRRQIAAGEIEEGGFAVE